MDNPWIDLPEGPPYVLPQDRPYVDDFNAAARRRGHGHT
jgi:hypothetical protein